MLHHDLFVKESKLAWLLWHMVMFFTNYVIETKILKDLSHTHMHARTQSLANAFSCLLCKIKFHVDDCLACKIVRINISHRVCIKNLSPTYKLRTCQSIRGPTGLLYTRGFQTVCCIVWSKLRNWWSNYKSAYHRFHAIK